MKTAKFLFPLLVATLCTTNNDLGERPNITMYGTRMKTGSENVVQLSCITNIGTDGCWMEFHKNDKTEDTIRLQDENCHHTRGTCDINICDCSKDCKAFKLNITSTPRITNTTYGCECRIVFKKVVYSLRKAIKSAGEEFVVFQTVISVVNTVVEDQGDKTEWSTGAVVGIFVGSVALVCVAALFIYGVWKKDVNPGTTEAGDKGPK